MAKVTITATRTIEQTKTAEVKVRIGDVKEWMKQEYGSNTYNDCGWDDPATLGEYFQAHEELIDEAEGDIDDLSYTDWEIQYAEEA